jgi:hypothetical protein
MQTKFSKLSKTTEISSLLIIISRLSRTRYREKSVLKVDKGRWGAHLQARGLGERRQLPQRGLGQSPSIELGVWGSVVSSPVGPGQSPGRQRFLVNFKCNLCIKNHTCQ